MQPSLNHHPGARCRKTRFIIVRHGQSDFNAQGRVQGCSDEPSLTNAGRRTANDVASYLSRAAISQVITSPLRRAREFAGRICSHLSVAAQNDDRLREIEMPLWEGLEIAALERNEPELYRWWKERPGSFVMRSGWRPIPDVFARAASFWQDFANRFTGETILLVTHAGTARALISTALAISPDRFHSLQQSNGGLTILDTAGGGAGFELVCLNTTGHLGESLPKLKDGHTGVRVLLLGNEAAGIDAYTALLPRLEGVPINRLVADPCTDVGFASLMLESIRGYSPDVSFGGAPRAVRIEPEFRTHMWTLNPSSMRRRIAGALGQNVQGWRFRRAPLGLTVLHYAASGHAPVIQTIDLPESQRWYEDNKVQICS